MPLDTDFHVAATERFIDANASAIIIHRPVRVSDGAGGWEDSYEEVLAPQTMRLVGSYLQSAQASRITSDGRVVVPEFLLIALPFADIAVGDTFTFEDKVHEVVFVSNHPEWRTHAAVYRHA